MDVNSLAERFGERLGDANTILLIGILVGLLFGIAAQQSRFCLRSATIEFWQGRIGEKFAIWLLTFAAALLGTQLLLSSDQLIPSQIRQLNGTGSLSGAILGGLMFGVGMILARGCASRLLVLAGSGNLRAFITGLLLTVVAQASLRGFLSPAREALSTLWTISGSERSLQTYLPTIVAPVLAGLLIVFALYIARREGMRPWTVLTAVLVGLAVMMGWWGTSWFAGWSFEGGTPQSITFTGPSTDTLMALINEPQMPRTFATGLVPGVFAGSAIAALLSRQFRVETFDANTGMTRYLAGAALMGFGSMLAGGCAVGAGVTGGAVLATTAWTALLSMWLGSALAIRLVPGERAPIVSQSQQSVAAGTA